MLPVPLKMSVRLSEVPTARIPLGMEFVPVRSVVAWKVALFRLTRIRPPVPRAWRFPRMTVPTSVGVPPAVEPIEKSLVMLTEEPEMSSVPVPYLVKPPADGLMR
jgi:hypothetical protein